MTAGDAPIFLGGCPRSGLTLLRVLLDGHPDISCGPDSGVVSLVRAARDLRESLGDLHARDFDLPRDKVRANFAVAIDAIVGARARAEGKARWAEKSPMNLLFFEDYAAMFPAARFVHIVRDGRDVVASLLKRGWKDPRTGRLFDYCASAEAAARYWKGLVAIGLAAERSLGSRVFRLTYEDLAARPQPMLTALCAFMNAPNAPAMLEFHGRELRLAGMETENAAELRRPINARQVGRHAREMTTSDIARVESVAGPELAALGYAARP